MVINHEQMKLFILRILQVIYCGKQHTAGLDSHHLTWWQVCDRDQGLAYQFFWLIVSVDSGKDGTVCACSVVQCELKEFFALRNCNTLFNLNCTEVRFAECIEVNMLLLIILRIS